MCLPGLAMAAFVQASQAEPKTILSGSAVVGIAQDLPKLQVMQLWLSLLQLEGVVALGIW